VKGQTLLHASLLSQSIDTLLCCVCKVFGAAVYEVKLADDGGGDDTSDPQNLTITVEFRNHAPSFTLSAPQVDALETSSAGAYAAPSSSSVSVESTVYGWMQTHQGAGCSAHSLL